MKFALLKTLGSGIALGLLLAGCGGGSDDPGPTTYNATLNVVGATDPTLNGVYTTGSISLSGVDKINPIGGEPEVCSFRFSGLQQVGNTRMLDGDIRYIPGTNELRVVFMSISGTEFSSRTVPGAAVDKPNNEVDFNGKILTASSGSGAVISVSGSIPMRTGRPEGC